MPTATELTLANVVPTCMLRPILIIVPTIVGTGPNLSVTVGASSWDSNAGYQRVAGYHGCFLLYAVCVVVVDVCAQPRGVS